jgi:hypothetical protein
MYQDELYREAALIVRGREAWLRDAAAAWTRFCAWLGLGER